MSTQTYQTHRHNPKLTGIGFLLLVVAVIAMALRWFYGGSTLFAIGLAALVGTNLVLLLISREYTTALQDRIIKLEMKVRAAELLAPESRAALAGLSKPQIVALRFASDEELPVLIARAGREQLTADQIKRAITNWVPDFDRT